MSRSVKVGSRARVRRWTLLLAAGALVALTSIAREVPAGAQSYPPITITPSEAAPGGTVTVRGERCFGLLGGGPSTVVVSVEGWDPVATQEYSDSELGAWSVQLPVPTDAQPGTHAVETICDYYGFGPEPYPDASLTVTALDNSTPTVTVQLGAAAVSVGDDLTVTGSGFLSGEDVTVTMLSDPVLLATVSADPNGDVSTVVTIPADTPPGDHHIELEGTTSGRTASTGLTATAIRGSAGDTTLPRTGSTHDLLATAGIGSVVAGAALVLWSRRFRRYIGRHLARP